MAVPTMDTLSLGKSAPRCVSITTKIILHSILNPLLKIQWFAFLFSFIDAILAVYFRTICKLSSCTVVMDDEQTSMHFWAPKRRDPRKPNLLMIHGYGGDSKWQFMYQAGPLSQSFNLYAPDLVFFGKSYSTRPDRTTAFQAKCVAQGMEQLGVGRYSVYSISYGGYVAYSMAEMNPESVEKMVIVSSGIALTEEQKAEHLGKLEKDVVDLLVPQKAEDLRLLLNLSIHKYDRFKGYPDIFLQGFIDETLLVWGDSDKVFPLVFGQQLQRHLGSKAKLKILKDTGHASNMESAHLLNDCMKEFLLSKSYFSKEN
ncbi:OLC1v1015131C1 [Oldenlandia corymbosa var. corymbosa]|uniref:OLC1v1015131C1 n=1 Tax=Oldenlandia corymbosa var. corymbosa TaxID=529605 RepID=A0AAV1E4Z1_OLDCO|nr:OLC1v1015131C1 [Oldenlandia corymbosa var. corymbosa]